MHVFNKVHIFEHMKSHIYEPNISLISLISLMFNYAKPRMSSLGHLTYHSVLIILNRMLFSEVYWKEFY